MLGSGFCDWDTDWDWLGVLPSVAVTLDETVCTCVRVPDNVRVPVTELVLDSVCVCEGVRVAVCD